MLPNSGSRLPRAVGLGLTAAILLDTAIQLAWKWAVLRAPEFASLAHGLGWVLHDPVFWALVALFTLQIVNWIFVLSRADLSFAQPITALSYVTVALGSNALLGEDLPFLRSAGIAAILAGVWLISGTSHRSPSAAGAPP